MYLEHLDEISVKIDDIYLDPNNPRFWGHGSRSQVPDNRVTEERVQARAAEEISKFGIEDLHYSILRNGFLPLDRLVVRELSGQSGKFVVVEGNRRLAALNMLRQRIADGLLEEDGVSDEDLALLTEQTESLQVLHYTGADYEDVSWLLQGIRHIGGIRDWEPAQRAKLVADQISDGTASFSTVGQKFGLSAIAVGRLYRSYKALQQMRSHPEYGSLARNDYFSLFEQAYRNAEIRRWLGWDEGSYAFTNTEALGQFYAWITPDEENAGRRRISDPKQLKSLATLVSDGHDSLIGQVDRHELTLEAAAATVEATPSPVDWRESLHASIERVASLPTESIAEDPREYHRLVREVIARLELYLKMAEALFEPTDAE